MTQACSGRRHSIISMISTATFHEKQASALDIAYVDVQPGKTFSSTESGFSFQYPDKWAIAIVCTCSRQRVHAKEDIILV
jgi:hypothetical protein